MRRFHGWLVLSLTLRALMGIRDDVTTDSITLAAFVFVYWVILIGIHENWSIAWKVSIIPPLMVVLGVGPFFVMNFYMFGIGHERYFDSPATIFVVYIVGVVALLPALILVSLTLLNYKWILNSTNQEIQ